MQETHFWSKNNLARLALKGLCSVEELLQQQAAGPVFVLSGRFWSIALSNFTYYKNISSMLLIRWFPVEIGSVLVSREPEVDLEQGRTTSYKNLIS